MKQITIKKNGQITNGPASFPTMEEAQAWLSHHEGMKSFGEPAQTIQQQVELSPAVLETQQVLVKEAELDEEGNEISPAEYEEQEVVIQEAVTEMQELHIPGSYEVEIVDISAELAQKQINAEAQAFLDATDWIVVRSAERGEQLSAEFKAERQAARQRIVK
jgi:hypothetical protein